MLDRAHTIAAVACMALIPLAPAGMWAYARLASVDRVETIAAASAVLASAPPPAGARLRGEPVVYEQLAWQGERSLVPVSGYTLSSSYALRAASTPRTLVAHYTRVLPGWTRSVERVDCQMLGLPARCGALYATFRRGGDKLIVNAAEYLVPPPPSAPARMLTSFGVDVSQKP